MDKPTRAAIERATARARTLLEEEFAAQLEGTFDILRSGTIAPEPGPHLGPAERTVRGRIIAAVDHRRAAGSTPAAAVADYLRDAAFTALNRFAALKMLESRGLVQECVARGEASAGYTEFCGMARGIPLLPNGAGYRLYIESLFDEISAEVNVLFDRRDPAAALWPRRNAFEALLELLNARELAEVWAEDETIGWIYQYFNTQEERRAMRDASQAPRNSRELAVRNQFFTPRYVVRFLVDNTLGRIWYEMRGGDTALAEACAFMERTAAPGAAPRPGKDPRDIRALDPACGSGHFLLYAFDLFAAIYLEAWEAPRDLPPAEATGRTLRQDYPEREALLRAMPGLILRHNLHGVDIDERCAQIAGLALWMRAQRAFTEHGIPRAGRPAIRRTNIVVAEPMPGETEMVAEFAAALEHGPGRDAEGTENDGGTDPGSGTESAAAGRAAAESAAAESAAGYGPAVAAVFRRLAEGLALAGDMGLLLRAERLTRGANSDAGAQGDLFAPADALIREELERYLATSAGDARRRRRLFAEDALHGLGLAELAELRYDAVLMNPPFGAGSARAKREFERAYPRTKNDIYAAFVERGIELLTPRGRLGAITSRTGFFLSSFRKWREEVLLAAAPPVVFADLGAGVLDGAMVETAAYCLEKLERPAAPTAPKARKGEVSAPKARKGEVSAPKARKGEVSAPKARKGAVSAPKARKGVVSTPIQKPAPDQHELFTEPRP